MTRYINELPRETQWSVYVELMRAGITGEDIARAMNSRLCDLENTIDIDEWR